MAFSLEEVLKRQREKLRDLETATELIKSKDAIREELLNMHEELSQTSTGIESLRNYVEQMKKQNDCCKQLLVMVETLDKQIIHMDQNLPPELVQDYKNNASRFSSTTSLQTTLPMEDLVEHSKTITEINTEEQENTMIDCKKILFKEQEVCQTIRPISQEEFSKIPKYIIGRQSLQTVNNMVNSLNQILTTKYTFLSQGKAHARKQGNLNLYLEYKKQEMDMRADNKYVYFFTTDDYERQTKSKLSKLKLNLITVLRHCKRIQQNTVKNEVRYILITNSTNSAFSSEVT